MNRLRLAPLVLLLTLLCGRHTAHAASTATAPHIQVALLADHATLTPGQPLRLGVHFRMEPGWHVYWENPGDSGEAPSITWTLPPGLRTGDILWPTPRRVATGPLVNYDYEDEVTLLTPLRSDASLPGMSVTVQAKVSWLVCSEPCIPGSAQLALTLPIQAPGSPAPPSPLGAALFAAADRALPRPAPPSLHLQATLDSKSFVIRADGDRLGGATFLPLIPDQIDNAAEQTFTPTPSGFTLRLARSEQLLKEPLVLPGLLVSAGRNLIVEIPVRAEAPAAAPVKPKPAAMALWLALLLALCGGVLLNLMPCVFPVLSLKVLGLVQLSGVDRARANGHALAYAAGILLSFWALAGTLIAMRYAGLALGWGFQLQSPRFLIGLCAVLFLLGLNLLGIFELGLAFTRAGQLTANHGGSSGYLGALGTGVLATIVATPCTAPFMGTAVGFALSQPALPALLIFTALGAGLALPYLLLVMMPGARRLLPRPGAWMETFKEIMGFLLFATVVWLAWVLGIAAGAEAVVALLAGLLVVGLASWFWHRYAGQFWATALGWLLVFAGALAPGSMATARAPSSDLQAAQASDDLMSERYTPQRLAELRAQRQPVLVDFTAAWCVSCKVNELLVLRSQPVRERLAQLGVITLKADWTTHDPAITAALAEFGRSGVPFYLLYGRDPGAAAITLPEVLSNSIVLRALDTLNQKGF